MASLKDYNEAKSELNEVRFKSECILESDKFDNPVYREGLESLAQVIQNLIFIEKGTYPNQPNLGVGIQKYLFEILDDTTILEIQSDIDSQIEEFIAHQYISVSTLVKKIEDMDKYKGNTLGITITIANTLTDSTIQINYLLGGSNKTKRVVSKLYLA